MFATKLCVLAALILAFPAPSQPQPQGPQGPQQELLVTTGRRSLFNLPIPKLPFSGLLDPTGLMNIVDSMKKLGPALQRRDFLLVGMKCLEVFRSLLKIVSIPGLSEIDSVLEVVHGFLESLHPFIMRLQETAQIVRAEEIAKGNGQLFEELRDDRSTASLLTDGAKMIAALPGRMFGK